MPAPSGNSNRFPNREHHVLVFTIFAVADFDVKLVFDIYGWERKSRQISSEVRRLGSAVRLTDPRLGAWESARAYKIVVRNAADPTVMELVADVETCQRRRVGSRNIRLDFAAGRRRPVPLG